MKPVIQELFQVGLYKRTQGRITRQVTFAALAMAIFLGCWRLYDAWTDQNFLLQYVIPGTLLASGWWLSYRIVNWPRFADFLIAVEAEMAKVTWPSRRELWRSAAVVLITMFVLTVILLAYDILWKWLLFDFLQIAGPPQTPTPGP